MQVILFRPNGFRSLGSIWAGNLQRHLVFVIVTYKIGADTDIGYQITIIDRRLIGNGLCVNEHFQFFILTHICSYFFKYCTGVTIFKITDLNRK
ncbi:hypothetical protein D3C86_1451790 [compost metagenome]